jgi:hypothetical protein
MSEVTLYGLGDTSDTDTIVKGLSSSGLDDEPPRPIRGCPSAG